MCPDLMGLSGDQFHFQKGFIPLLSDGFVCCSDTGLLCLVCNGDNEDLIAFFIFMQISLDQMLSLHLPFDIGLIIFMKRPVLQKFSKQLRTSQGFGAEHDPACIPVQTIADRRLIYGKFLLRYAAAFKQIPDQPLIQGNILLCRFLG